LIDTKPFHEVFARANANPMWNVYSDALINLKAYPTEEKLHIFTFFYKPYIREMMELALLDFETISGWKECDGNLLVFEFFVVSLSFLLFVSQRPLWCLAVCR